MEFRFLCPSCGRKLRAAEDAAGMNVECPDCGAEIPVPPVPQPEVSLPPAQPAPSPAPPVKPAVEPSREPAGVLPDRTMFIIKVVVCGVLVLAGIIFILNETYGSPRHSMKQLRLAAERRDQETVLKYVDANPLSDSIRQAVYDQYENGITTNHNDDISWVLHPLGEVLGRRIIDTLITPESVVSLFCGEPANEVFKSGGDSTGQNIDQLTQGTGFKNQLGAFVGNVLIQGTANDIGGAGYQYTTKYESSTRYLITVRPSNPADPVWGYVYKRTGFATWKFSEMRLLK